MKIRFEELTEQQEGILGDLQDFFKETIKRKFCDHFSRCESPIEELLLGSLIVYGLAESMPIEVHCAPLGEDPSWSLLGNNIEHTLIYPQKRVGNYRVDFLINHQELHPNGIDKIDLIVECDGHDFHEKTKDQARKDRKRDRELQASGYSVFRFTGSEIYNTPMKCAENIFEFLINQINIIRKKRLAL